MPVTRATNVQQRQEMARLAKEGQSQQAVAGQLGASFWTARKWVRRAHQGGLAALVTNLGRPETGPMAGFDPQVRYVTLRPSASTLLGVGSIWSRKWANGHLWKAKRCPKPPRCGVTGVPLAATCSQAPSTETQVATCWCGTWNVANGRQRVCTNPSWCGNDYFQLGTR
jgi:hypothetical protein